MLKDKLNRKFKNGDKLLYITDDDNKECIFESYITNDTSIGTKLCVIRVNQIQTVVSIKDLEYPIEEILKIL